MARDTVLQLNNRYVLEHSTDGTNWVEIPFIGSMSVTPGEAPTTEGTTFGAPYQTTGAVTPGSVTIEVESQAPHLPVYASVYSAAVNSTTTRIRITNYQETVKAQVSGDTVAIAADGGLTFAGDAPDFSGDDYSRGMVILIGTNRHIIDDITTDDPAVATVVAPASAVSATQYSIIRPRIRKGPIAGRWASPGTDELTSGETSKRSMTFNANSTIPDWVMLGA